MREPTLSATDPDHLGDIVNDVLDSIHDNGDFDDARENLPNYPVAEHEAVIAAMRAFRDALWSLTPEPEVEPDPRLVELFNRPSRITVPPSIELRLRFVVKDNDVVVESCGGDEPDHMPPFEHLATGPRAGVTEAVACEVQYQIAALLGEHN
jgi:hypothetical protein